MSPRIVRMLQLRGQLDGLPTITAEHRAKIAQVDTLIESVDGPGIGLEESRTRAYAAIRLMKAQGFETAFPGTNTRVGVLHEMITMLGEMIKRAF